MHVRFLERYGLIPVILLLFAGSARGEKDIADQLVEAQSEYRASQYDEALKRLEPLLVAANLDGGLAAKARGLAARVLHSRGEERFRQARITDALADFEREVQLQPEVAAEHWQRGIAYYYAGDYEKGAKQFELHRTVNPQDVENAAWHFLCLVRTPKGSVEAARKKLISVTRDERVPMAQIQQMFAGKTRSEDVLRAAESKGDAAKFYADLYVGLYHEARGRAEESLRFISKAAENPAGKNSYMGDVARVHVILRSKESQATRSQEPKAKK